MIGPRTVYDGEPLEVERLLLFSSPLARGPGVAEVVTLASLHRTHGSRMRIRLVLVAMIAAATATACATARHAVSHVVAGGCDREWRPIAVTNRVLEVVPGEKRALGRPYIFDGPFGMKELSKSCPVLYAVRGSRATVDPRGNLAVPADAVPGSTFEVLVYTAGTWGRQTASVVDPGPNPLAGTWSQSGETCPADMAPYPRIGELIFQRNLQYAVTEQPFERVYGFWGTYRYNAATGRLWLSQPGGAPDREYRATLNERGELVIENFKGTPPRTCTAIFQNSGTTYRP